MAFDSLNACYIDALQIMIATFIQSVKVYNKTFESFTNFLKFRCENYG